MEEGFILTKNLALGSELQTSKQWLPLISKLSLLCISTSVLVIRSPLPNSKNTVFSTDLSSFHLKEEEKHKKNTKNLFQPAFMCPCTPKLVKILFSCYFVFKRYCHFVRFHLVQNKPHIFDHFLIIQSSGLKSWKKGSQCLFSLKPTTP